MDYARQLPKVVVCLSSECLCTTLYENSTSSLRPILGIACLFYFGQSVTKRGNDLQRLTWQGKCKCSPGEEGCCVMVLEARVCSAPTSCILARGNWWGSLLARTSALPLPHVKDHSSAAVIPSRPCITLPQVTEL